MLVRAALILALVPTLALAASGITVPAAPSAQPTASAATPPVAIAPLPLPADPGDCRIGCANDRYMCEASDHPEGCAGTWSQCVATCDAPNLQAGVSTAP
jgi:hypothetical protein